MSQPYKPAMVLALLGASALLTAVAAAQSQGQACLHGADEAAYQRDRRIAAIQMARQVNAAEARLHEQQGKYVSLSELKDVAVPPTGFVPTIVVGPFAYALIAKDTFDPCGFALFSDQAGLVYEGRPATAPTE